VTSGQDSDRVPQRQSIAELPAGSDADECR